MEKKSVLLIATGGTIASRPGEDGLSPALTSEELLRCIPDIIFSVLIRWFPFRARPSENRQTKPTPSEC